MKPKLMGALALLSLALPALAAEPAKPAPKPAAATAAAESGPREIQLLTLDGKEAKLSDYAARVTVVTLWTSQFTNLENLKRVEALHQRYKQDKDVAFLAVCVDQPKKPEDFEALKELTQPLGLTYPVVVDSKLQLLSVVNDTDYGGRIPPSARVYALVLLDHAGHVLDKGGMASSGPYEDFVKETAQDIEDARKKAR